jgi:hypothetical protein
MSHSRCRFCQTGIQSRDGHRECPSCLGMQHLLDDIENPCAAAIELTLQERVQRAKHLTGGKEMIPSSSSHKRKRPDETIRSPSSDMPQDKRERATVVQEPKDDTQLQILAALRDLAGKLETRNTSISTQPSAVPIAPSPGDELTSHREERDNSMDAVSLHANNSLYGSEEDIGKNEEDESRSEVSEGSLHSDILSRILSAARILGLDAQEEATAPTPTQGVWTSISPAQPTMSIPVAEDYSQMLRKAWNNPKAAPQFNAGCRRFVKLDYPPESGMGNMPSVEREIAALTTLGPDKVTDNPRCPGKECQKTDRLMSQAYNAATRAARSGNALAIVLAALRKVVNKEEHDMMSLIDTALITHSQLTRDIGASMSSAILARRQIWLAQTSLPDAIKKDLTNMPVVPGRIFHTDSQSLLDSADQARRRRESVQQTFGGLTKYGHRAAHSFQPPHFPRSETWGYDRRRTRGYQFYDRGTRPFYQAPQTDQSHTPVRGGSFKRRTTRGFKPRGGQA